MGEIGVFLDVWLPVMIQAGVLGLMSLSGIWVTWLCGKCRGVPCLAVIFYFMLCLGGYVFFYFCAAFSWRFLPAVEWIAGWTAIFGCIFHIKAVLDDRKRKLPPEADGGDTNLHPEEDV